MIFSNRSFLKKRQLNFQLPLQISLNRAASRNTFVKAAAPILEAALFPTVSKKLISRDGRKKSAASRNQCLEMATNRATSKDRCSTIKFEFFKQPQIKKATKTKVVDLNK